ncbi:MAG TPA: 3,4-dihydroxy-2-butanone-4-phosphate synthase [Steroidobacteraceae bacterium]|nr:3,4-dihydroxy-2-butanone-4-phosphate synthase [Steroidobacteraceae bacterium]
MSKVLTLTGKPAAPPAPTAGLNSVEEIVADLRAGRMVIVMDDEDRENEGDLIMAAELATPEAVAFMIRHASGIICVPMEEEQLTRLDLPQMVATNSESHRTAFTVSVDLRAGTTTGVSSGDRAATIRGLADARSKPQDFARPGHIFPLRSRRGGVLVRTGHTEAAVDLCRLAGLQPAGVICEVMNDDGTMARRPQLEAFAVRHNLKIGTIADLIRYRLRNERSVERVTAQPVQTEIGEFTLYAYEDRMSQDVHLALTRGTLRGEEPPLVRVHVVDPLRDLLGIRSDPLAWTLRAAMERIARAGSGVIVILRDRESPGDLLESVRSLSAPTSQDASSAAPTPAHGARRDGEVLRTFGVGAQILKDLGVRRMRVLSAPKQIHGISGFGLEIDSYVGEDG